jgi:hypothetical protein
MTVISFFILPFFLRLMMMLMMLMMMIMLMMLMRMMIAAPTAIVDGCKPGVVVVVVVSSSSSSSPSASFFYSASQFYSYYLGWHASVSHSDSTCMTHCFMMSGLHDVWWQAVTQDMTSWRSASLETSSPSTPTVCVSLNTH